MAWIHFLMSFAFSFGIHAILMVKCKIRFRQAVWSGLFAGFLSGLSIFLVESTRSFSFQFLFGMNLFFVLCFTLVWILFRFYRDPERKIPTQPGVVVSPADGRIRYMIKVKNGQFLWSIKKGKAIPLNEIFPLFHWGSRDIMMIGIEMSLFDVHVNRAPISGRVVALKKIPGKFLSLRGFDFLKENERVLSIIENEEMKIGMVQIASHLVRRILFYPKQGHFVQRGERIGMIRFGSQVDVLIPIQKGIRFFVTSGQYVKAGETILAKYRLP